MIRKYAEGTTVPVSQSRAEVRKLLAGAGAVRFVTEESTTDWELKAEIGGRWYSFRVDVPDWHDFTEDARWTYSDVQAKQRAAQEHRRRWRVLCYLLKAKIVATAEGADGDQPNEDLARELMPHLMLPKGGTVGELYREQAELLYATGKLPALPAPGED